MCDYCGCLNEQVIARLSADHVAISAAADALRGAYLTGDRTAAKGLAVALNELLAPHAAEEERGLFVELAAVGAQQHTEALTNEHAQLDAVFSAVAAGDAGAWEQLPTALAALERHIWREDYDVFPAALQLLDPPAWKRVTDSVTASVAHAP